MTSPARSVSSGARVVHAHNLHPALGWRALAGAREAGARVVLHLHQYRLVCAIGVCYTRGAECTRCHGRDTLPGVRLNCRFSLPEALAYGAALSLWQRRIIDQADALIVPSVFARERLRALGAPLPWERVHVLPPPVPSLARAAPAPSSQTEAMGSEPATGQPTGPYALVVSRLAPEKGVDVAIAACREAGLALVVAGDGPELAPLRELAGEDDVRFAGRVAHSELDRLRAGASIALVPSRSAETFGMAAAEAMARALPVAASRIGALPELLDDESCLAPPGDASALAEAIARVLADPAAGRRGLERVRALCGPDVVARELAGVYDGAGGT